MKRVFKQGVNLLSVLVAMVLAVVASSCSEDANVESPTGDLTFDNVTIEIAAAEGSIYNVQGTCDTTWEARFETEVEWVSLSQITGEGDVDLTLTAIKNPTTTSRETKMIIWGAGKTYLFTITQLASSSELSLDLGGFEAVAAGESFEVAVTSTTTWKLGVLPSWIVASTSTGSGDGSFTVTVSENSTYAERSYEMSVQTADGSVVLPVTISQVEQSLPTISVASEFTTFDRESTSSQSVNVECSSDDWSATKLDENDDWYSIIANTEMNTLTIIPSSNEGTIRRSQFSIVATKYGVNSDEVTLTIEQDGDAVSMSLNIEDYTPTRTDEYEQGDAILIQNTIELTANCEWSAQIADNTGASADDWFTMMPMKGSASEDPQTLTLDIKKNPNDSDRYVIVTIWANDLESYTQFKVTQEGSIVKLMVSDTTLSVDKDGVASSGLTVLATEPWTATLSEGAESWFHLTTTSGNGSGSEDSFSSEDLSFTIDPSVTSLATRSAVITIKIDSSDDVIDLKTITITQDEAVLTNPDAITLISALAELNGEGGSYIPTGWGNVDLNDWEGVTIDAEEYVTGVELPSKGFAGSLPETLTSLTKLEVVDFSNNSLSGAFPTMYGTSNFSAMTSFDIRNNNITGTPPEAMSDFADMATFAVSGNKLSGTLHANYALHDHYFDWVALTNVFPQQGDSDDTCTVHLADLALKFNSLGAARVFYFGTGGASWTTIAQPEWISSSYIGDGDGGFEVTTANTDVTGMGVMNGEIRSLGGVSGTTGNTIRNGSGSIPLEICMASKSIFEIRLNSCGFSGVIPQAVLENVTNIAMTGCANIVMSIEYLLTNISATADNTSSGTRDAMKCLLIWSGIYGEFTPELQQTFMDKYGYTGTSKALFKLCGNTNLYGELTSDFITFLKTENGSGLSDAEIETYFTTGTGLTIAE